MAREIGSTRPGIAATSRTGEGSVAIEEGKSRRDVLKALGAAAAGAVAGGVLKPDSARADHGVINATSTDNTRPAVHAKHVAGGTAIEASSFDGTAVDASGGPIGVKVTGFVYGLWAEADEAAIFARGTSEFGIIGSGPFVGVSGRGRVGVQGSASPGGEAGVVGSGGFNGDGVRGSALGSGAGVRAEAFDDTATALHVEGSAKFSTAGDGSIPGGHDSATVSDPKVTGASHVTVTLTGDPGQATSSPGSKAAVVWVERRPGTGFVVHMSRPVRFTTPFTYLIVEPA
jgi:hypothetical protein